jgi:hypothetical protein
VTACSREQDAARAHPSQAIVTRDASGLYVLVRNGNGPVTVNISAVSGYGGTAKIYEYSAFHKDEVVDAVPTPAARP